MTTIQCKTNVRLKGVTPALAFILFALEEFVRKSHAANLPDNLVLTAIYDGEHAPDSKHYIGEALDVRSKNFKGLAEKASFRSQLEAALNNHPLAVAQGLGNRFRVLFENAGAENEHFHVQVKKGEHFPGV